MLLELLMAFNVYIDSFNPLQYEKQMLITQDIIRNIENEEGVRYKRYKDSEGYITVGIGHNMDNPDSKRIWREAGVTESWGSVYSGIATLSKLSAEKLLKYQLTMTINELKAIFPTFDSFSYPRKKALINMHYQLGDYKFKKFSKTIEHINNGDFYEAALQMKHSKWAKQTPARVKRITSLMLLDGDSYA